MENVNKPSTNIKNWATDERPREKLLQHGATALSNSELLAILLNTGSKNKSAVALAKEILNLGNNNLDEIGKLTVADFQKINGVGQAKSIIIAAALEFGRRRHTLTLNTKSVINRSSDIARYIQVQLQDHAYENFGIVFLNRANKIIQFEIISKGGITGTVADPRIILKKALDYRATSLILCHNHPSGNLNPSRADEELTKKLITAASYLDISILDHIIVSSEGFYSFADEGKM